ncbi:hypothetical protein CRENBAI_025441 [Crenichthys baileyi]|uniref:Uncharacterized protein n=1 Tax=Crenichthys baileyi TaxID=28760 RepID=A0AAV9SRL3_9TELE
MQQQDVKARAMYGEDIEILPSPLLLEEIEKTFLGSRLVLVPLSYGPDVLAGASNPLPEGHAEAFPDLMVRTGASSSFPVGLVDTIPLHLTSSILLLTSTCPPSPTPQISTPGRLTPASTEGQPDSTGSPDQPFATLFQSPFPAHLTLRVLPTLQLLPMASHHRCCRLLTSHPLLMFLSSSGLWRRSSGLRRGFQQFLRALLSSSMGSNVPSSSVGPSLSASTCSFVAGLQTTVIAPVTDLLNSFSVAADLPDFFSASLQFLVIIAVAGRQGPFYLAS